jgi:hypothetical protein
MAGCTNKSFTSLSEVLNNFRGADKNFGDIICFVEIVTKMLLDLAGILAAIMVLYSAFQYVTSLGEESKAESAKKTLTWALVGLAVVVLSAVIKNIILREAGGV